MITETDLKNKIHDCVEKLDTYEALIDSKVKTHDDNLTNIASAYRQIKSELAFIRKEEKIINAIQTDNNLIVAHVVKKREKLYFRAVELLATIIVELKAASSS